MDRNARFTQTPSEQAQVADRAYVLGNAGQKVPAPARHRDESARSDPSPNTFQVVLLTVNEVSFRQYERDLISFGFGVQACHDLAMLYQAMEGKTSPLVALIAPLPMVHMAVAQLRTLDNEAGIIAMTNFPDRESRIGTLLSGVDACLESAPDAVELAALLLAIQRRRRKGTLSTAAEERADQDDALNHPADVLQSPGEQRHPLGAALTAHSIKWRLINNGWTLMSPDGGALSLTTSERQLMLALMNAPDKHLSREDAIVNHSKYGQLPDAEIKTARYLDVMISRLRRKATAQGMDLPIRSLRGSGYMFSSEC